MRGCSYLSIRIKALAGCEENGDIKVTVGNGPVDWQAIVVIAEGCEFGVGVEEGLYFGGCGAEVS